MRKLVSAVQASASLPFGDEHGRAEHECSDAVCAASSASAASRIPTPPESGVRTVESVRAEEAHRILKAMPPRKLAKARTEFVRRFDALMHDHLLRGEEAYSNGAVARACDVDEKTVRQWRSGEKLLRAETVGLFPSRLRDEVLAIIKELAGGLRQKAMGER